MNIDTVKSESVGRWPGILTSLGVQVGEGKHTACPICGGKDRFRFDDKDGRGTWICNQCGAGDGFVLAQKILGVDFKAACEAVAGIVGTVAPSAYQADERPDPCALRALFKDSKPVKEGDLVDQYLKRRGLESLPNGLRITHKCWEPETKKHQAAMLAVFHLPNSEAVTMHRTYLDPVTAQKLKIESPKKIMPPLKKMTGGAVRLYPHEGVIGIAEGIETAIAVHDVVGVPCWAALSAILLAGFEPPKGVRRVQVYGDNDANFTGQKAAYILGNRLAISGLEVTVEIPTVVGHDFADEVL